ncbi:hypothetical protein SAMN02745243_04143, partial [Hespellia stercorisuis DSM 15480]
MKQKCRSPTKNVSADYLYSGLSANDLQESGLSRVLKAQGLPLVIWELAGINLSAR